MLAEPADNPLAVDVTTLDEVRALGLRKPRRFRFDRLTGKTDLVANDTQAPGLPAG